MKSDSTYMTKDLASATYIAYNGVKFADKYDRKSRSWVFQNPETCEKLDLKLRNGEATVEVTKFESTRRILLGMVRDSNAGKSGGKDYDTPNGDKQ